MIWQKHSELRNQHALFSPSQNSWLRYDDVKIAERVKNQYRTALGTELHEYVASQIVMNHKVTSVRNLVMGVENLKIQFICTATACGKREFT